MPLNTTIALRWVTRIPSILDMVELIDNWKMFIKRTQMTNHHPGSKTIVDDSAFSGCYAMSLVERQIQ